MEVQVFDEPKLLFASGQTMQDPHDGLTFFGPAGAGEAKHPASISWSVIGLQGGVDAYTQFANVLSAPIPSPEGKSKALWPAFPGFEAAFHSRLHGRPVHSMLLNDKQLHSAATHVDANVRVGSVVDLYMEQLKKIDKLDERPSLVICVTPDYIDENCRPQSNVKEAHGQKISRAEKNLRQAGQGDLFESYNVDHYDYSPDYRRQLKARAMELNIPIQIVLESTLKALSPEATQEFGKTPLSDRAWNLATAMYYKAGGKPWQLASIRDGVCYVGLTFKKVMDGESSLSACCAAQMFLKDGDGIVFKGEEGRWYSPEDKTFHLTKTAAKNLLKGVLDSYQDQFGKPLKEIFVHCHSQLGKEEIDGFLAATPPGAKLIVVRVRQERYDFRLYREGSRPVLRGTFGRLNKQIGYLWASGFKPRLQMYDGPETPAPLKISVLHGDVDVTEIARDIFALTKLNYNTCRLGEANPVTIGFASAIGDILVANRKAKGRPQIKFYI